MQFLFVTIYVLIAAAVTVHVLQTKSDVRAALAWIAVAWLSPIFGALLYFVFGINRVTRRALHLGHARPPGGAAAGPDAQPDGGTTISASLAAAGQRVTGSPLIAGNAVTAYHGGDEAYPAMLEAIRNARHSVALASYIFRHDAVGHAFVAALIEAQTARRRGARADRQRRQRLFLVGDAARARSRPACRPPASCTPGCRGACRSSTCATIRSC